MQRGNVLKGALALIALCGVHGAALAVDLGPGDIVLTASSSRYASEGAWLPAVNDARDAASIHAIASGVEVNAMAKHCAQINPLLAIRADEARNRWWRHNNAMVQAAYGYVNLQRAILQVKQGEAVATAWRDNVMASAKDGAVATLRDWFPDEVQDAATCDRVIGEYLTSDRDVDTNAEFGTTLGALAGDMQAYADANHAQ